MLTGYFRNTHAQVILSVCDINADHMDLGQKHFVKSSQWEKKIDSSHPG